MTRFVHCGVHRQEFRRIVRDAERPEPTIIGCPNCGQWYFADTASEEEAPDLEETVSEAEERLKRECPDHAHTFEVSAYGGLK